MDNTVLFSISKQDFEAIIIESVKSCLEQEFKSQKLAEAQDQLLTREEACSFLKINSSTLWSWTNKGKVKAYGIGSRRYYKRSELIESLLVVKN